MESKSISSHGGSARKPFRVRSHKSYKPVVLRQGSGSSRARHDAAFNRMLHLVLANMPNADAEMQKENVMWLEEWASKGHAYKVAQEGGIGAVISAMSQYPENADIQEFSCSALAAWSRNSQVLANMVVAAGGISAVLKAMSDHSDHAYIQECALSALAALSIDTESHGAELLKKHAIPVALQAMKDHLNNVDVQAHGLHLLCNLITVTGAQDADAVVQDEVEPAAHALQQIATSDGIRIILASLHHHSQQDVQQRGILALAVLANVDEDSRSLMDKLNAAEAVIGALKRHPKSVGIQRFSCTLLSLLGQPDQLHSGNDSIAAIVTSMGHHEQNEAALRDACLALARANGSMNTNWCKAADAVVAAVARHPQSSKLRADAETALGRIGSELNQDLLPQLLDSHSALSVSALHGQDSEDDLQASDATDSDWTDEESNELLHEDDEWTDDEILDLRFDPFSDVLDEEDEDLFPVPRRRVRFAIEDTHADEEAMDLLEPNMQDKGSSSSSEQQSVLPATADNLAFSLMVTLGVSAVCLVAFQLWKRQ